MPTNPTYKAAAIGPQELLSGLLAVGVDVYHATNANQCLEVISTIDKAGTQYGVLLIPEDIVSTIPLDTYNELIARPLPVILTIPTMQSAPDAGLSKLRELTKRAIGSDIFTS